MSRNAGSPFLKLARARLHLRYLRKEVKRFEKRRPFASALKPARTAPWSHFIFR
jgi:hypothetical protein